MTLFPVPAGSRITTAIINHAYSLSDTNATVVTAATMGPLSTPYTIPAGDAAAGIAYRLTCGGLGTWGSTQQILQLQETFGGQTVGVAPQIGATEFNVNAVFRWRAVLDMVCQTPGSTGTWFGGMSFELSSTAGSILSAGVGNNATIAGADGNATALTQDTTASISFGLQAKWNSATGSPTITCLRTIFERLG